MAAIIAAHHFHHENVFYFRSSLKLTAKAPKNGWLEYDRFLLGDVFFQGG